MSSAVLVFGVALLFARRALVQALSAENFLSERDIMLQALEYTTLLGVAYIPCHCAINRAAGSLRETIVTAPGESPIDAFVRQKSAAAVDEVLQIRLNDWRSLGPGFAILAPALWGLLEDIAKNSLK